MIAAISTNSTRGDERPIRILPYALYLLLICCPVKIVCWGDLQLRKMPMHCSEKKFL